jgi:hypothetical protein
MQAEEHTAHKYSFEIMEMEAGTNNERINLVFPAILSPPLMDHNLKRMPWHPL